MTQAQLDANGFQLAEEIATQLRKDIVEIDRQLGDNSSGSMDIETNPALPLPKTRKPRVKKNETPITTNAVMGIPITNDLSIKEKKKPGPKPKPKPPQIPKEIANPKVEQEPPKNNKRKRNSSASPPKKRAKLEETDLERRVAILEEQQSQMQFFIANINMGPLQERVDALEQKRGKVTLTSQMNKTLYGVQ